MLIRSSRRAFLGAAAALAVGCGGKPPVSPRQPRVVSLSPSTTEALFAIGAGRLVVGRSRFCDHPASVDTLPTVGGFADPSLEAILGLQPTLVVGAHGPAGPGFAERLSAQGIETYFPETESFEQIEAMLMGLGGRLNHAYEAHSVVTRLKVHKAAVLAATKDLPAPRAVMLFDVGPIVVAGPGGFPDELLHMAHAQNVIVEGGAYPTIGLERLIALDPEVILDGASAGVEGLSPLVAKRGAPGWSSLRAFEKNRVHTLGSTVLRPGPRIGDGLRELCRAIHGEALQLK